MRGEVLPDADEEARSPVAHEEVVVGDAARGRLGLAAAPPAREAGGSAPRVVMGLHRGPPRILWTNAHRKAERPSVPDLDDRPRLIDSSDMSVPASARAVVVGGGVVGCSIAYHLAKLGWR